MFKKNKRRLQIPLTSHVDKLPEKLQKRLKSSRAGTFYQEVFCHLDETPFVVLYADIPSRLNVPVSVLVGKEKNTQNQILYSFVPVGKVIQSVFNHSMKPQYFLVSL